jgi:hypothetical protein
VHAFAAAARAAGEPMETPRDAAPDHAAALFPSGGSRQVRDLRGTGIADCSATSWPPASPSSR